MTAIDLYSGIGGWTLGLRMAGIEVIASYEWWKEANHTHHKNFGSQHKEMDIRTLDLKNLPGKEKVDFVIGSPPCTQFSFANKGGKGDINDGLVDIKKFLEVVDYLQPKYWAMENIPRVANILERELGEGRTLAKYRHLFGDIKVYNAADYGVPQDRKRMIAGNFPFGLMDAYAATTIKRTLEDVLRALDRSSIIDPIYNIQLDKSSLTDHIPEPNLSSEEARINQESKMHHPIYNVMSFPDRQDRPSRTITALCTRVSRESIIIRDAQDNLRRLTIRERACLQSFPINYQFFSKTYAGKIKMIGNAVPPLLTFYIAQSMLETPVEQLIMPCNIPAERLVLSGGQATSHIPSGNRGDYSWDRSFRLAIKGLRFGSGVRFELKNYNERQTKGTTWRINFYYGTSKEINQKELDYQLLRKVFYATGLKEDNSFIELFNNLKELIDTVDEEELQKNWANINREMTGPIYLIDKLADHVARLREYFEKEGVLYISSINEFIKEEFGLSSGTKPNKLEEKGTGIFIGILIGSCFNIMMKSKVLMLGRSRVRA